MKYAADGEQAGDHEGGTQSPQQVGTQEAEADGDQRRAHNHRRQRAGGELGEEQGVAGGFARNLVGHHQTRCRHRNSNEGWIHWIVRAAADCSSA